MAPKVPQQWKDGGQALFHDHGLFFEGSRQPSAWPEEHKHTFDVIREIWAVTYQTYWRESKLPNNLRHDRRNIVRDIAKRARTMRYAYEDTWRGLEHEIVRIFTRSAVCQDCEKELYVFEHEAEPLDRVKAAELQRRRNKRSECTCHTNNNSVDIEPQDQDDAQPIIFCTAQSQPMTHWHLDNFEGTRIPMEPDRTIGLSASLRMQQALRRSSSNIDHYPLRGPNEVLYPFLLIESKRALKSPGFTAIEAQTAFPFRKILLLQDALRRESGADFHPLAWFFANQGEEWRLYAGTMKESKVHVYDLWHGTVESLDGSLQIFLIADYLWTWARDVYRPQIRDCLCALAPLLRDMTPSTLASLSRSQSVLSEPSSVLSRGPQLDIAMEEVLPVNSEMPLPNDALTETDRNRLQLYLSIPHINHEGGLSQTGMWHSDLVRFSFCCTLLSAESPALSNVQMADELVGNVLAYQSEKKTIAILRLRHIYALEKLWTGKDSSPTAAQAARIPNNQFNIVIIRFRSMCRREDWQIVRHLECLVWLHAGIQECELLLGQQEMPDHYTSIRRALPAVRSLAGERSVLCALNESQLTLSGFSWSNAASPLKWAAGPLTTTTRVHNFFTSLLDTTNGFLESSELVVIDQLNRNVTPAEVLEATLPMPEETSQMGGMLATKPQSWPAQCPKFCLFVLVDIEASDRHRLGSVLREAINNRNIYGPLDEQSQHEELKLNQEDRELLRRWTRSFG